MPTLIYLIGFMGSGKSTLGSIVANVLGYEFIDLDDVLEDRFGCTIEAFFREKGESAFREAEHLLIKETVTMERKVVAPGGGAFLLEPNRKLMLNHGVTVYVRVPASLLVARLRRSRHRPLLFDEDGRTVEGQALHERVTRLLAEREATYERAHLVVDVKEDSVGLTVDRIVSRLKDY